MIDGDRLIDWFRESEDFFREWRIEARDNYELTAGRQWTEEELAYLEEQLRPAITFNRIAPILDSIHGHQIQNRQETRYLPRELSDQGLTDLANATAKWVDDECAADHEISHALLDAAIAGVGFCEMRMDYTIDTRGQLISAERVSPLEMYWDPSSKKRNLTDAKYVIRGRWYRREEAEIYWPKLKSLEMREIWEDPTLLFDPQIIRARRYERYDSTTTWIRPHKDEVYIIQCQYWQLEDIYRVADPTTQKVVELESKEFNKVKERFDQLGLQYVRQKRRVYYQLFSVGPEILDHGKGPCPFAFTFMPITGKRDETKGTWYGLIRQMRDPQRWANKFFSDIQHYVASNRRGGAFVEEDAFADARKAEENWNDPSGLIMLTSGALGQGKVLERNPTAFPAGLDRLLNFAIASLPDVTGINLELLGLVDRTQPGILEQQRKQAGLTILAPLFDSLRNFMLLRGKILLFFIKEYLSDGRIVRIVGEEEARYLPLIFNDDIEKYDVIVDTAPTSTNSKEQVFGVMTQLLPFFESSGLGPPPDLIRYLPLPAVLTEKWAAQLEEMKRNTQPPPEVMMKQKELELKEKDMMMDQQRDQNKLMIEQERVRFDAMIRQADLTMRQELAKLDLMVKEKEIELEIIRADIEREKGVMALTQDQDRFILDMHKRRMELEQNMKKAMIDLQKQQVDFITKTEQGLAKIGGIEGIPTTISNNVNQMISETVTGLKEQLNTQLNTLQQPKEMDIVWDESGRIVRVGDRKIIRDETGRAIQVVH